MMSESFNAAALQKNSHMMVGELLHRPPPPHQKKYFRNTEQHVEEQQQQDMEEQHHQQQLESSTTEASPTAGGQNLKAVDCEVSVTSSGTKQDLSDPATAAPAA